MKNLDWQNIIEKLEGFATSLKAKELLQGTAPLPSPQEALQQFSETSHALELIQGGIRPHMLSIDGFKLWWERIRKNAVLKTLELRDVRRFCHEALALREAVRSLKSDWSKNIFNTLMDAERPLSAIDQLITPQGEIRTDASERLHQLYTEKTNIARQVQKLLDQLVKSFDIEPVLQDKYVTNREGRWVLPIRSGAQHQFPGIIHASSHSKQTVFMEPEQTIQLNNRLAQIEIEIEDEIERLLTELSSYLSSLTVEFAGTAEVMVAADVRLSHAQLAFALKANPCRFDSKEINLKNLKHPMLVLKEQPVVGNTVELNQERRILLLSGPNAGGKTVLLKSVGLAAQMARCGLMICADEGSSLPFFKNLVVAVGDAQSVDAQLSTFAAHVRILDEAVQSRGSDNLLLIDEICGSTDPEEGCALARSFIETYAKAEVFGVITSHLGPLKQGWNEQSGVTNGSLEYDTKTGSPTYQFLLGVPGDSLALQTAMRVGVRPKILERARELLSPEARKFHDSLLELENVKSKLASMQTELMHKVKKAEESEREFHRLKNDFENQKQSWFEKFMESTEKKVNEIIEQAKVQQIFKKFEVMSQIKQSFPEIIKPSEARTTSQSPIHSAEDFAKAFPPGTSVFVPQLSQDGVIQGTPNAKGEVPVLSQSLRLVIPWQELQAPRKQSNPTAQLLRKASVSVALSQDFESSVDLRGLRVDEAISKLEIALDQAALKGQDRLKVVHGHGTEALKKSIRSHLSRSPYVKVWQAGQDDGVTWVEL